MSCNRSHWKLRLRDGLGVSMSALKFLPDTETETKFEICRWVTRGNLVSKAIDFLGVGDENHIAKLMHAFAVWRAAVRHVIDYTHPDLLNSNANVTVHGTATLIVAAQWAAFDETLDFHPAFQGMAKFMKDETFMEAVLDAMNTFGLQMSVGGCKTHLFATAKVSAFGQQRIHELNDSEDAAKMIPLVFQAALAKYLQLESIGSFPKLIDSNFGGCFKVEADEDGWNALASAVEHRMRASIPEARGRP